MSTGKKNFIIISIVLSVTILVIGILLLPDTIIMQIDSYGNAQNIMPKTAAF